MDEEIENIPEETIEEPTTKKNPKRVEQGKRLAAISKQAKEDKMRRKIESENFSYFPYIIYSVALLSTSGFFYLLLKKDKSDHQMTVIHQSPKKESPKKEIPKKKFESLN